MGNGICFPTEHLKSAQELVQYVSVHSVSNWDLAVSVFEERGKPEYPEKNLSEQGENQKQTQPTYDAATGNRTRATLVGGECSHHCATPAPKNNPITTTPTEGGLPVLLQGVWVTEIITGFPVWQSQSENV